MLSAFLGDHGQLDRLADQGASGGFGDAADDPGRLALVSTGTYPRLCLLMWVWLVRGILDRPFIIEPATLLGFPQLDGGTHEETIYRRADHPDSARRRTG